ncbi:unnamed protein product [Clonostachys rosea]|uniref:FAD-binding domain-containing protein n=1 Tax=Bionectria ochroleuca TaxID=29856 RepID=A0ABY6TZL0_BIOOC|nr:unnamed protein product [Clonostachys rosea]
MEADLETTDVIICGCGPTGAMLSAFLGRHKVPNIVLEKEASITTDPRGIALDEDGIRLVQALGAYSAAFTKIGSCVPGVRFVSGVHTELNRKEFLYFDTGSTAGNTGHVGILGHNQPVLEEHLRLAMSTTGFSNLRSSCTLVSISEDDDWVYATYTDASGAGAEKRIRGRFLVGADGKTGFTRKKYLEPRGIQMQWAEGNKYQESWVALNWRISLPTPETHPNFPLWELGFTPSQVYDEFFPRDFSFLCNPKRPAVCGRFGLECDRLWRFEFLVVDGEDDMWMAGPEMIQQVVYPYLRHPGSRYGLNEDVEFPQDCIEVLRCRPFRFYARSCNKWSLGRVVLCGDAAHVFPPFGGQGIVSGFRDAVALSWRLAIMCQSNTKSYGTLLEGWYIERKKQLETSLASTVRNGDMVNSKNPLTIFVRDWSLWLLQFIPSMKRKLELGPRVYGPSRYEYSLGMAFMPDLGGGCSFGQSYCVELKGRDVREGHVQFSDDVIFEPTKQKLFQIVVLLDNTEQSTNAENELQGLDSISSRLSPAEATMFVRRRSLDKVSMARELTNRRIFRTATGIEFGQSRLCDGHPQPRGYEEECMWNGLEGKRYIIVRYDRFIFAACNSRAELEKAARRLSELFP